jgi:nucleotide-binding universal stress UspA family protein
MYKRILVGIDGSKTSDQALQEAIKLAKEMQAQLRIVYAVDTVNFNLDMEFPNPPEYSNALINSGQAILKKAETVATKADVSFETKLLEIDTLGKRIPEVIAAEAENWPADLIVLCTHGRKGLSHLFLGSVSEGVVRAATKPVLLIRAK